MLGNNYGAGKTMSEELRKQHSDRMKKKNPMASTVAIKKRTATIKKKHGADFYSKLFKRLWAERKLAGRKLSMKERKAISARMKANNPMKRASVVAKAAGNYSPERKAMLSERMKKTWRDGKITPSMFIGKGNVKGANKMERLLFPIIRRHRGRFVGDGTFWIRVTASGISRNPDFIFGSGKDKIALLVHGEFWHRDEAKAKAELNDYIADGWNVLVIWTRRISKWMIPAIKAEIVSWLNEVRSSPSKMPAVRQFMTWNASRITTS